ncbi:hypothetical protein LCGC14_1254760 [marine sediment metagenome]|uniref:Uncharacterized protein n=1 Tax=marine sediment metagenome TaxID=412755 RepID=A0A0F9NJ27_9ZZZZ
MESDFFVRRFGDNSMTEEDVRKLLLSDETIDESDLFVKQIEGTDDLQELNTELAKFEDIKKSSSYSNKVREPGDSGK